MKRILFLVLCIALACVSVACAINEKKTVYSISYDEHNDSSAESAASMDVSDDNQGTEGLGSSAVASDTSYYESSHADTEQEKLKQFYTTRPCYGAGTNALLLENIQVHVFFTDDNESSWTKQEINAYFNTQIKLGFEFIEKEAKRYGIPLTVTYELYGTALGKGQVIKYEGVVSDGSDGHHDLDTVNHAARDIGYSNKAAMYYDLFEKNDYCEVVFLSVFNKDGISYAHQQAEDNGSAIVEGAVVFTSYLDYDFKLNENTHMAATVAHEILHLFGAQDLYEEEFKDYAKTKYSNDIMLMDYRNIEEMIVGKFTAYSVGWRENPPAF